MQNQHLATQLNAAFTSTNQPTASVQAARPGRSRWGRTALGTAALALVVGLTGCGQGTSAAAPSGPAAVPVRVATVVEREVTDWDTFTGRFEAVESVQLRPRVSGYIEAVRFIEGTEVKKGDILFVIDQRPYQVRLEQAQAELSRVQAQSELAKTELQRTRKLLSTHAVSQEEFDRRASQHSQLLAEVQAASAAVETAALDLEYTEVAAPIGGRISQANVTVGNYVRAGESVLTSVVSLDPIYVAFESDEQTFLKYQALAQSGARPHSGNEANRVTIGLANETDFPHVAAMNFIDNALNPGTGTIRMRALIKNSDRRFTPGMLARVRLQGSRSYAAPVIDDSAVGTDQDRKYVMVVNDKDVAEYRPVEVGGSHSGGRVVHKGLAAGERIIVGGLQRVRPGMPVTPEDVSSSGTNDLAARR